MSNPGDEMQKTAMAEDPLLIRDSEIIESSSLTANDLEFDHVSALKNPFNSNNSDYDASAQKVEESLNHDYIPAEACDLVIMEVLKLDVTQESSTNDDEVSLHTGIEPLDLNRDKVDSISDDNISVHTCSEELDLDDTQESTRSDISVQTAIEDVDSVIEDNLNGSSDLTMSDESWEWIEDERSSEQDDKVSTQTDIDTLNEHVAADMSVHTAVEDVLHKLLMGVDDDNASVNTAVEELDLDITQDSDISDNEDNVSVKTALEASEFDVPQVSTPENLSTAIGMVRHEMARARHTLADARRQKQKQAEKTVLEPTGQFIWPTQMGDSILRNVCLILGVFFFVIALQVHIYQLQSQLEEANMKVKQFETGIEYILTALNGKDFALHTLPVTSSPKEKCTQFHLLKQIGFTDRKFQICVFY